VRAVAVEGRLVSVELVDERLGACPVPRRAVRAGAEVVGYLVHHDALVGVRAAEADAAEVVGLGGGDAGVVVDVDVVIAEVAVGVVAVDG
jgi:hypothetical protein